MKVKNNGIIEILYDLKPKRLICKFVIPFYRELLYQRMLIEQRNDIHMNIARLIQHSKFSYMPAKTEVNLLKYHLKKTEKSLINHMEDDESDLHHIKEEKSTLANRKIVLVKEICQKLKMIEKKLDFESSEVTLNSKFGLIMEGVIAKKSDKGITWEK